MRSARLDALRGLAMVWMTAFHLSFDLSYLGWWPQDFYNDARWTVQRTCIVSLFLLCAGAGQALAVHRGQSGSAFTRRWLQIAGCALLVSLGSWWMFPRSFIYFGVLHGMAVMLLLLRLSAKRWRGSEALWWLLGAGALALAWLGHLVVRSHSGLDVLNQPGLNWIGLTSRKPITEDYVPLLPWLGLMLWGFAGTRWLLLHRPHWLDGPLPTGARTLAILGRWSLSWYMVHQPLMIGLLSAARWHSQV
ncbi:MAG: heparan-alpha-glucosaminide N-acetyltransferase [Betaproteobacteria bacterium]